MHKVGCTSKKYPEGRVEEWKGKSEEYYTLLEDYFETRYHDYLELAVHEYFKLNRVVYTDPKGVELRLEWFLIGSKELIEGIKKV